MEGEYLVTVTQYFRSLQSIKRLILHSIMQLKEGGNNKRGVPAFLVDIAKPLQIYYNSGMAGIVSFYQDFLFFQSRNHLFLHFAFHSLTHFRQFQWNSYIPVHVEVPALILKKAFCVVWHGTEPARLF